MDHSRVNPLNANQTAGSRNQLTNNGSAGHAASRNTSMSSASAPSMQKAGQFGVVRAATSLRLGDVIRGEISDLSNGEITITLENNTMIRGQISDHSMLSIGQTAAFRLDSLTSQGILLEPVGNYSETELTLILKALEEANLPNTEYNQSAVKALMDNMMPISRESIQQLMQQAYDMKTADMNTLALMNRLMMKVTPDSIRQFSNYRNGTEQLAVQLKNFSEDIPSLLRALSENGSADAVAKFGETLLQLTLTNENPLSSPLLINTLSGEELTELRLLLSDTAMTEDTLQALNNGTLSLREALTMLRDSALSGTLHLPENTSSDALAERLAQIAQTLEPVNQQTSTEIRDSFQSVLSLQESDESSIHPEEAANAPIAEATPENSTTTENTSPLSFAGKFLHTLQETVGNSVTDTLQMLRSAGTVTEEVSPPIATVIDKICDLFSTEANKSDLTGQVLSQQGRQELAAFLERLPISSSLLTRLVSGEASTQEVMHAIKNVIPLSDPGILQQMFQSESFALLFSRNLASNWSLTPDRLQQEGQPDHFLNQLHQQMHQLEHLIQSSLSGSDSGQLGQSAHDIQSNIAFMKALSETFSYMQLPLKLPNQTANSELYVYTQKEQRRMNPDKISVLLHLDLEHLGTLEIRLNKEKQDIQANFTLENDASIDLLRTNINLLEEELASLGYQSHIRVSRQEDTPVTMDQFLNTRVKTKATEEMKRFSFDIRA